MAKDCISILPMSNINGVYGTRPKIARTPNAGPSMYTCTILYIVVCTCRRTDMHLESLQVWDEMCIRRPRSCIRKNCNSS